ncbi:hypothetical protein X773_09375 [Mesorhizobium sp. LSJC285A00]|nr:hypothetical protein X773_09375 [Mesorhizobium sp. LSJC285A00]ESX05193.1 hypothetical protein X768_28030 [Mesorhizobium sp. LSJC265A00]
MPWIKNRFDRDHRVVQMAGLCGPGHLSCQWDPDGIDAMSTERIDELTPRTAAGADRCVGQFDIVEQNPFLATTQEFLQGLLQRGTDKALSHRTAS